METYSSEHVAQQAAAAFDHAIDVELERQALIDAGAEWFIVSHTVTYFAGNTERALENVLAFSHEEAEQIIRDQFGSSTVIEGSISEREIEEC